MPDQRRLATAGQPHDAEYLAAVDRQADIGNADYRIEFSQNLGFAQLPVALVSGLW